MHSDAHAAFQHPTGTATAADQPDGAHVDRPPFVRGTLRAVCEPLSDVTACAGLHGIMVVDPQGVIRFCNSDAARLLEHDAGQLMGRPVAALLPDLRLKSGTPGYNLAYALFWFPGECWRRVHARRADGNTVPLSVSLSASRIDGRHQLVLGLRP